MTAISASKVFFRMNAVHYDGSPHTHCFWPCHMFPQDQGLDVTPVDEDNWALVTEFGV